MAVRLFVGNLPYDVTEAELRAHFSAHGPLAYLSIAMDRETGKPRGFAFVEFHERADAEEAIRLLNSQMFKGRPLAVSEARARDEQARPGAPRSAAPRPTAPRSTAPRPPSAAATPAGDGRDFGPDAVPRRRRPLAKRAVHAERGPKRPIYNRAAGPVRFNMTEDENDEEEERGAQGIRRRVNTNEPDTA